jgi:DNA uptake protein ComE-like DNA-binding protein
MFLKRFRSLSFLTLILCAATFGQIGPTPPTFPRSDGRNTKTEQVNINSAGREQLAALPGIGEEYADKVMAGRPYKNKKELKTRKILPEANYKQVADKITTK